MTGEINKVAVLKKIFSEDIELFGKFFFKHHLKLETPRFHKEIFELLSGENERIAIAAPRGHAKTTIVDLVYLSWLIVNQRLKFVLLISDTYSQATLFLETLKAEFESNERLKAFYGDLKTEKWSEEEIVVGTTMVKALGANMKVRGLKYRNWRPDLVICDDLENDEMVENKDRREKLARWFTGALIPSLAKGGKVVVIGTILHYDSMLNNLVSEKRYPEWKKKIYRAIMDGKPLWPEHLDMAALDQIKTNYLREGMGFLFYQEYMNDPVSDQFRKFKFEKVKFFDPKDIQGAQMNVYMAIDRAYSMEKTADFTGIIVVGVDNSNRWYILHAERFKGLEKDLIEKIFDLKKFYSPLKVGLEQRAYVYTLKPTMDEEMRRRNMFFKIEELKDLGKSKALRIEALLPRYEAGSMFFKKGQDDLIDELTTFPRGTYDDLADALAYVATMAVVPYNPDNLDPYYAKHGTAYRARQSKWR